MQPFCLILPAGQKNRPICPSLQISLVISGATRADAQLVDRAAQGADYSLIDLHYTKRPRNFQPEFPKKFRSFSRKCPKTPSFLSLCDPPFHSGVLYKSLHFKLCNSTNFPFHFLLTFPRHAVYNCSELETDYFSDCQKGRCLCRKTLPRKGFLRCSSRLT